MPTPHIVRKGIDAVMANVSRAAAPKAQDMADASPLSGEQSSPAEVPPAAVGESQVVEPETVKPEAPAPVEAAAPSPSAVEPVAHQPPATAADAEPDEQRPPRIIALMNQKGGVGKTTTTVNLGAALAKGGQRVLLIDLDPQGHLTLSLGVDPQELDATVYDMLVDDDVSALDIVREVGKRLAILPAEVNLAGVEAELTPKVVTGQAQRELSNKVRPLIESGEFDYVLIDCPPSLGLLTINALILATEVVVPMQAHFLALQGMSKLFETVSHIRAGFNRELIISGVVLCMFEGQTILASEVTNEVTEYLTASRDQDVPWRHAVIFEPAVRRNIKLAECPSFGQTIFDYAPECAGAHDYLRLAKSVHRQKIPV